MIPVYIKKLELEITRDCNGKCLHCMRGKAQDVSLSTDLLKKLFVGKNHEIVGIGNIFLTGGEIFLNKEGLIYLLNYLLENKIFVSEIKMVINSTIYDEEVIELLKTFHLNGTIVMISYFKDQFHPVVPGDILEKYYKLPFYNFNSLYLKERNIIRIGSAQKNHIGNKIYAKSEMRKFAKVEPYLIIDGITEDRVVVDSFYLTAKGKFGSRPTDASWKMIDSKYYLDIQENSIFKDCLFSEEIIKSLNNPQVFSKKYWPPKLLEDYNKAVANGYEDIFLKELKYNIRDYFTETASYKRIRRY